MGTDKYHIQVSHHLRVGKDASVASYWSNDVIFHTPVFSAVMKRNRYKLLLRFMHFNDNSQLSTVFPQTQDRLFKVRPLIDHLFEKFQSAYCVQQDVSVNESLLLWSVSECVVS